ncbi:MAG: undecaprenyldiphospho-muramoylpentapeptide beta-N-acetylglucosaminyltransferase [Bacteroidetes bacterium 43-16]|nr:MAG: undecaprenyldiphospho-muramoylpentapeptide beta-N-acetylglucosaminyltransferase [Bacteroidetes bacterium 43-16]
MKVIIAGGGTGGHIFPAVAIANAVQRLYAGTEVLFIGALGKMEMEKVPQAGYKIIGLDIAGLNRSNWLKNLSLPFKLWKSRKKAKEIIREFQPDVVIGVGGFASYPMLSAAQALGIPTLIQEQNSFAGKSNKRLGAKAKAICVAYDNMSQFFPEQAIIQTGNPVRAAIARSKVTKEEGLSAFALDNKQQTLLIVGGSLGAKAINEAIAAGLKTLTDAGLQLIWQTGEPFYQEALKAAAPYGDQVKVHAFIKNMESAYAAADIVISRAGALAIAELCIVAKPVIFVPYPFAAEDHQTSNAMSLVNKDAAWMVKNEHAAAQLVAKLLELVNETGTQAVMHNNLQRLAVDDADERIARIVKSIAKS